MRKWLGVCNVWYRLNAEVVAVVIGVRYVVFVCGRVRAACFSLFVFGLELGVPADWRRNAACACARSHFFAMRSALSYARSTRAREGLVAGV